MLVPHDAPLETFPDSVQTGAPVSQAVVPVRHGLPLTLQVAPAVQPTQLPVEPQTLFVPQLVPAARSVPLSLQTGVPVVQVSAPRWQGFVGTQLAPSAQATHCSARQTIPAPQEVPFGWSPDSVQTEAPVAHEIVPVRQGLPDGEQAPPAIQVTQAPELQTLPSPQTVPFACGCCVSVQDATPAEQAACPTWQGLAGAQTLPGVQAGTSVPPSVVRPAAPPVAPPLPPVPPRPPVFGEPPAPVVPAAPSHESSWSRRPQPRPTPPRTIVTSTNRRSIPGLRLLKNAGCSRARGHRGPGHRQRLERRRRAPCC
jgi:hypothetical protein